MKKGMRRLTATVMLGIMFVLMIAFAACDNEWDSAIKNTIKEFTADNANYSMSTTCIYGVGLAQEYGYKEKLFVGNGKYYSVRTNLDGEDESVGDVYNNYYTLVRDDHKNDAIYQSMLLGSVIGKSNYFTNEDGKYTVNDDKKEELAARIFEFTTNFDIVKEMHYVISDNKVTEYYILLDRSSAVSDTSILAPIGMKFAFEYGNVTI